MTIDGNIVVAVVGLGYVGLPLSVEFGVKYTTIGYDLSETKIASYKSNFDPTGEVSSQNFKAATNLTFSSDPSSISEANIVVVTVPTPIDEANNPDFSPLISASTTVGRHMRKGTIIVYESTVYPGATEDICIPVLEQISGFEWKRDFNVGYSPERLNPGDKERTLTNIVKVVAGDSGSTLEVLSGLYESIVTAGVHRVSSLKVAEAAKVIENTQRDLNIALMNELAIIFDKIGIDTMEVLEAAGTKWNFLPFRPGLVGGHCIGIDPYYLTHKAEMVGYHPQVILAGRRINDGMAAYVAQQTVKQLINEGSAIRGAKIIILGLTFKEDCPDIRNSKVINLIREFEEFGCEVIIHDPVADNVEAFEEYGLKLTAWKDLPVSDALVVAVAHKDYVEKPLNTVLAKLKKSGIFVDVKAVFSQNKILRMGFRVWRL